MDSGRFVGFFNTLTEVLLPGFKLDLRHLLEETTIGGGRV